MQGTGIRLFMSGMLLATVGGNVRAEALQPDPAWQQGKLINGFSWQVLTTPQRPNDRIELRLMVNTGSLAENAQQTGFARLLPRLALAHSENFSATQLKSLWQQGVDAGRPQAPAVISYDYTLYSLSLPNGRPDLLRDAFRWMANTGGRLIINPATIHSATQGADPVATAPDKPGSTWWHYRLKGSVLLAHDPGQSARLPVSGQQLQQFYQRWYTPDAMTLYVVGNVDGRGLNEQIVKAFSSLKGKRDTPPPMPALSPLPSQPVSLISDNGKEDSLKLIWDAPWQPIRDSRSLNLYWRSDLAREALYMHVQQALQASKDNNLKQANLRFDCNVHYQRAQCAIHIDTPAENLMPTMTFVAHELAGLRNSGLGKAEFDALMARKTGELSTLFATYARTDTGILMSQRLRSQQNDVVDIAPEQYQKLRNEFLSQLSLPMLNQELRNQLSQNAILVLMQPKDEPEVNMKALQETYDHIMAPGPQPSSIDESKPEVTDIPPQS
ncbi:insulinase family protein [Sodalis ligni]|jgi:zinc protease|uniref:Putative Zn-dependent peptidase n=1 Tax=Sodalis ligni TaxID=2697027 RepID=A0A4R1NCY9_9GAMM|nr:pitrilysin family protein [Sodalis ligni]QWA11368.1 insulinase family protein [Sodalis ligni]TCL05253.1 putative Zn-dependent peptidase [Sodalis ligni]